MREPPINTDMYWAWLAKGALALIASGLIIVYGLAVWIDHYSFGKSWAQVFGLQK